MGIDFYYTPGSAPCRSVLLTANALGIELNLILVDLRKKEHLRPEFIKINPKHTVPTLVDNGLILWESRAIITYLVQEYGKDDSLYPKNPKKRALVDQILYFDLEKLHPAFADCYYPTIFSGSTSPAQKHLDKAREIFKFLDALLERHTYSAGDHLTVADLALVATVSTYEAMNFDFRDYPNVVNWLDVIKTTAPGYEEVNGKNVLVFKEMVEKLSRKLETSV
ncbi:hypothetical protein ILUMI_20884 [Ignelater luminosus]|uniref:Uncharacterized protein n=1 Tax=Ignelater luminosus TaxID=2038154 RepID=A0A8K0CHL8_IGNLU|nr:hypothetical protein ILUMI_20884 [Ignelater luminosus]